MTTNGAATTTTTQAAAGSETQNATQETPSYLSQKDLDTWGSQFAKKFNGELAGLRKLIEGMVGKGGTPAQTPQAGGQEQPAAAPSVGTKDPTQARKIDRELGKLEAELGDGVIDALGEDYPQLEPEQQLRLLRAAKAIQGRDVQAGDATRSGETPEKEARGETPGKTKQTPRAAAPQPRDSAPPRPANRREYDKLDKKARDLLSKDPNFDPNDLPL